MKVLVDANADRNTLLPVFLRLTEDSDQNVKSTAWNIFISYSLVDAKQELSRLKKLQETGKNNSNNLAPSSH
jgi:hypothetical protein